MSTNITRITMSTEKLEVLPVANNTAEVRHEYLAKFDFDHFSLFPPLAARRVFCARCRNPQLEEDDRKSESVWKYVLKGSVI